MRRLSAFTRRVRQHLRLARAQRVRDYRVRRRQRGANGHVLLRLQRQHLRDPFRVFERRSGLHYAAIQRPNAVPRSTPSCTRGRVSTVGELTKCGHSSFLTRVGGVVV
jgi:hypothetical protein